MDSMREKESSDRKRSRSPHHHRDYHIKRHCRSLSRSPHREHPRRRHRDHGHHGESRVKEQVALPYQQHLLEKRDLERNTALLAEYLDVQKSIDMHQLSRDEVKGRWKSFLGKWNRGELAEGWYDPEVGRKAAERFQSRLPPPQKESRPDLDDGAALKRPPECVHDSGGEEEDDFGPSLPARDSRPSGPGIPSRQDLQHRQELIEQAERDGNTDIRYIRKLDRELHESRLEELVPRADPGSRERQLEKKANQTSTLHSFREAKESGEEEVKDCHLMGGDEGGGLQAELKKRQRAKNEREIRKEESLRARQAEREERMRGVREKEEKTMALLRSIAKERFG